MLCLDGNKHGIEGLGQIAEFVPPQLGSSQTEVDALDDFTGRLAHQNNRRRNHRQEVHKAGKNTHACLLSISHPADANHDGAALLGHSDEIGWGVSGIKNLAIEDVLPMQVILEILADLAAQVEAPQGSTAHV